MVYLEIQDWDLCGFNNCFYKVEATGLFVGSRRSEDFCGNMLKL